MTCISKAQALACEMRENLFKRILPDESIIFFCTLFVESDELDTVLTSVY